MAGPCRTPAPLWGTDVTLGAVGSRRGSARYEQMLCACQRHVGQCVSRMSNLLQPWAQLLLP